MTLLDERRILDVVLGFQIPLKPVMNPLCNLLDPNVGHPCVLTNVLTPNTASRFLISTAWS